MHRTRPADLLSYRSNRTAVPRLIALSAMLSLATLWAGSAAAIPMDYDLRFDGALVGGFTLDPDMAAGAGLSDVEVSAFDLSVDVNGYGLVAFDLGDVTGGSPIRGVFLDGQLATLTTAGATGNLPGSGDPFFLDFTPAIPADVTMIDLPNAGAYNLMIPLAPDFPDKLGSYGIGLAAESPIPEPSATLLFSVGSLFAYATVGRRGTRSQRDG